ncbi:hypothetical protein, partial [Enterobacter bugandensis]|uniref:hypothetical protein n=1 Tax=Enterobacter bugandensis TaxID=881260 RepID=UPI001955233E
RIISKVGPTKPVAITSTPCQQLADHYQAVVIPARVDKPKVNVGIQSSERRRLARLCHQVFFSLESTHW